MDNKKYPKNNFIRVRNNYSHNFIGNFTNHIYQKQLGNIFLIHKEDHKIIVKENENYLPIV